MSRTTRKHHSGHTSPVVNGRFFIVFRPFGSDCITAAFHRIVNERKQSDTRLSDRLRPVYGHRNVGPGHSYPAFDRYSQWKTYTHCFVRPFYCCQQL
jgi:hypothetical protein